MNISEEKNVSKDEQLETLNIKSKKSKEEITMHKDIALQQLNNFMCKYIENPNRIDKADKLAYWLEDYCRLLNFEKKFNPKFLKKYERGDVIKVNLGYNIGNEEGGLHYCVVLDKHNSKTSGIITVIPLTSDKKQELHYSEVPLGNEIFINFTQKYQTLHFELSQKINKLMRQETCKVSVHEIDEAMESLRLLSKIRDELNKMKQGSIAMVSQVTTISKQRIYDPQKTGDILDGLHISDQSLDLINTKMKQLFIKN